MSTGNNVTTFELLFDGDKSEMIQKLYLLCLDKEEKIVDINHNMLNKYLSKLTDKTITNSRFIATCKYLEEIFIKNGGGLC